MLKGSLHFSKVSWNMCIVTYCQLLNYILYFLDCLLCQKSLHSIIENIYREIFFFKLRMSPRKITKYYCIPLRMIQYICYPLLHPIRFTGLKCKKSFIVVWLEKLNSTQGGPLRLKTLYWNALEMPKIKSPCLGKYHANSALY